MSAKPIAYCNFESPMGEMIGGATPDGLCFLEWHDRGGVHRILARVEKRYRTIPTEQSEENRHLVQLRSELNEYFQGIRKTFEVAIDVKGTPFERSVWDRLLKLKYGETKSYAEMASSIDNPKAVRAVGRANGANYLAVVIPCHRIIESNGGLGGYGGKLWRKKKLLALEGAGPTNELKLDA